MGPSRWGMPRTVLLNRMVLFGPLNPAHLAYAMRRYLDIRLFLKVTRTSLFPVFLLTRAAAGAAEVFFQPGPRHRNLDKLD